MTGARDRVEALLAAQGLAVVATSEAGAPYASLVAIAADTCDSVYFATTRATHKWHNLTAEPRVSLLVDDRTNGPEDFHAATAATALGRVEECEGDAADAGRRLLLSRHPYLAEFLASPSTAVLCVRVDRWYVVTRFQSVDRFDCRDSGA